MRTQLQTNKLTNPDLLLFDSSKFSQTLFFPKTLYWLAEMKPLYFLLLEANLVHSSEKLLRFHQRGMWKCESGLTFQQEVRMRECLICIFVFAMRHAEMCKRFNVPIRSLYARVFDLRFFMQRIELKIRTRIFVLMFR